MTSGMKWHHQVRLQQVDRTNNDPGESWMGNEPLNTTSDQWHFNMVGEVPSQS